MPHFGGISPHIKCQKSDEASGGLKLAPLSAQGARGQWETVRGRSEVVQ